MEDKNIKIIINRLCSERSLVKNALLELEELERIATEYEANKHYIELGKAVKYAVQNEIRFIRQMTNGEKYAFIDKYDKAKLLKIFNEMVEENKNMKACIYRAQAQGGEFNE